MAGLFLAVFVLFPVYQFSFCFLPSRGCYVSYLLTQTVKNLPAMWETQVQSLGGEDPLEKGVATPSRILAWRIPWTEEGYNPWGGRESDTTE